MASLNIFCKISNCPEYEEYNFVESKSYACKLQGQSYYKDNVPKGGPHSREAFMWANDLEEEDMINDI